MDYEKYYKELKDLIEKKGISYDMELIRKAYDLASESHEGQMRKSGDPYITHPVEVAKILVGLVMDTDTICAALLHDVVEDTDVALSELKKTFGEKVALLVDGVTKLGKISNMAKDSDYLRSEDQKSKEEEQAENVRKMFIAMSKDIRVIIIKLADRLHNMRTLAFKSEAKRLEISHETLIIYAPIAHRLGIRAIKDELEDLAMRYMDIYSYNQIQDALDAYTRESGEFLERIKSVLSAKIREHIPFASIEGRVKSVYGIWRKMYNNTSKEQIKNFDEIYDVFAFRIVVDSVHDCYNALGIVHDIFKSMPGRFKDYISMPKPNMYKSLHTTVIGKEGIPFEVQIRTWEMHQTAEYGIAAHWKYKVGLSDKNGKISEKLNWIREMLENQQESEDVADIVSAIKTDLIAEEVYVFTPKGKVIDLPYGSTIVDFAYKIHTEVGHSMVGAKANGKIVPLDYKIQTGDKVEILTSPYSGKGPNRDWLKMAKTGAAKNKIRVWFKKERREDNIAEGKKELLNEFSRNRINMSEDEMANYVQNVAVRHRYNNVDDFYAAIGYGGIDLSKIIPRVKEEYIERLRTDEDILREINSSSASDKPRKNRKNGEIIVDGIDDWKIKLSKCCNPLPGDEIIGFITRGYGVSIHKRDCVNVPKDVSTAEDPDRWREAYWENVKTDSFKSTLSIVANDRNNLIKDIVAKIESMHNHIYTLNTRQSKDGKCYILITTSVNDLDHLKLVIDKLRAIKGVISVERSGL